MKKMKNISISSVSTDKSKHEGVVLQYLGQAGFLIKSKGGKKIVIDPYLTNCVEQACGFKRMQPAVAKPEDIQPDIILSTHSHPDHLDVNAFPTFASSINAFFVGAPDCEEVYKSLGLSRERYRILREGESIQIRDTIIRAIYADHGKLAPDAVGFLIETDGMTIYNVGDSCLWQSSAFWSRWGRCRWI